MADKVEGFKIPVGRNVKRWRTIVKVPKVVSFRLEGKSLIVRLACGHEFVAYTVRGRRHCYDCPQQEINWEEPCEGYKEILIKDTTPQ